MNDELNGDDDSIESLDDNPQTDDQLVENTGEEESTQVQLETDFENEILNDYVRRCIEPIDGEDPCGESDDPSSSVISQIETTGDGIHNSLRTSFGEAARDDSHNSFDMSSAGRDADGLVDQIVDCLSEKSKSLLLASYLPHLMLITYGPEGFEAGLTVIRELTLRYGENAYPRDNTKLAGFLRSGVYIGHDDKITDNYRLFLYLPVTEPGNLPYALLRNAKLIETNNKIKSRYASDASKTSVEFYVNLIGSLERTAERAREVNAAIGDLLGEKRTDEMGKPLEIVSFQFIESVERMGNIVRNLATEHCPGYPPIEEEEENSDQGAVGVAAAAPQVASGEIVDRDQAIRLLEKIADFFYKTERHSPISYRIRDTIKWCKMDFPELLQLLLGEDQSSLAEMQKRVGFDDPAASDSGSYEESE